MSVRLDQCVVMEMNRSSMKTNGCVPCSILVILDMVGFVGSSHNLNRQFLYLSNTVVCDVTPYTVVEVFQLFVGMICLHSRGCFLHLSSKKQVSPKRNFHWAG
jgi:hypothetical protein